MTLFKKLVVIDAYLFPVHPDDDIDEHTHEGQVAQGDESGEHGGFAEEFGYAHKYMLKVDVRFSRQR